MTPTSQPSRRRKSPPNYHYGPGGIERVPSRRFLLVRDRDVSGVSGTGVVAEGIQFHDKQCVISWFGQYHSMEVHPSIEQVMVLHGHGGATRLNWIDLKEDTDD